MKRILLVHWNLEEARLKAVKLEAAGYEVQLLTGGSREFLRQLAMSPPVAIAIDLTRLPSQGRDIGLTFRHTAATRQVPLVFLEGDPDKVARVKELLPDAVFSTWGRVRSALKKAIANAPEKPVIPSSVFAGYSGTPLPKKLGIKPGSAVALANAPAEFVKTLGEVPPGASFLDRPRVDTNLILCFVTSCAQLEREAPKMACFSSTQPVWFIWPKKASGIVSDLTEKEVRRAGLAAGMVDYKVCAVDAVWSGLLFRLRR